MGKHGPCHHCGVTSTPLWRNGPPEKPVLCNACGSRWRTKGTLANYTPLHMREVHELDVPKRPKEKGASCKVKVRSLSLHKGQWSNRFTEVESGTGECSQSFQKGIDEDVSNRSSSGSALSFSESCAHFSGADVSEVTGSFHSNVWETIVPSQKRTCVIHPNRSAVEKLTMDLHSIMHAQSSYLTVSSDEDLIYESSPPTGLIEIGNGSVLIRHPNPATIDEESEATSFPLPNTACSSLPFVIDNQSKGSALSDVCNAKIKSSPVQELPKRDNSSQEKRILRIKDSKLGFIVLQDIVCNERYMKNLTNEERQQLMQYLPSIDTAKSPESIESMFTSPEFSESISCFQRLLREGIFDLSTTEMNSEDCKHLRELVLSNLSKSVWTEFYMIHKTAVYAKAREVHGVEDGATIFYHSSTASLKRTHESHYDNFAEPKAIMRSPKKPCKGEQHFLTSVKSIRQNSVKLEKKPDVEESSNCFSSNDPEKSCIFSSVQLINSSPDEELLLDIRSSTSFPDAELLSDAWICNAPAKRSSLESKAPGKDDIALCPSSMSFTSNLQKQW